MATAPSPEVVDLLQKLETKNPAMDLTQAPELIKYALTESVDRRKGIIASIQNCEAEGALAGKKAELIQLRESIAPGRVASFADEAFKMLDPNVANQTAAGELVEMGKGVSNGNPVEIIAHGTPLAAGGIAVLMGFDVVKQSWREIGRKQGFFGKTGQVFKALGVTLLAGTGVAFAINGTKRLMKMAH